MPTFIPSERLSVKTKQKGTRGVLRFNRALPNPSENNELYRKEHERIFPPKKEDAEDSDAAA